MIEGKLSYEECHKEIEGILHKFCKICEKWFPATQDNFYPKNTKEGLSPYCKECEKAKNKKYSQLHNDQRYWYNKKYLSNPENLNKINKGIRERRRKEGKVKQWQRDNKDKIKIYQEKRKQHGEHKINKKEWIACKEYFNNCCAYCGLSIEEHYINFQGEIRLGDFHKEHVNHTGANDLSNCVPSCKACNSSKHDFKFEDWYVESNQRFNKDRLDKIHKWLNEDWKLCYIENNL
jgi:uncharacterized protein YuzB (UPF0349 family)